MGENVLHVSTLDVLSSVHVMLAMQWCTALVWFGSLGIYYLWDPNSPIAEAWTPYSFLQLAGFAIFACGQLAYSELLILPGFTYPAAVCDCVEDETRQIETSATQRLSIPREEVR